MSAQLAPVAPLRGQAIGPVPESERIEVIDILRGFALFGVLMINMRNFDLPAQVWTGTMDRVALWVILAFGDSKFWTIFSFLFGLGFALQMQRAECRGAHFVGIYARRLLVLLVFGIAHFLVYPGDILYDYAITGFLLLVVRARPSRTIVALALICYVIPIGYYAAEVRTKVARRSDPQAIQAATEERARQKQEDKEWTWMVTRATFPKVLARHAKRIVPVHFKVERYLWEPGGPGGLLGGPFPLFLLGLLAGRYQVFQNIRRYLPFFRKFGWWAFAVGTVCSLVSITGNWPDPVLAYETRHWRGLLWYLGTPALSFSYTSGVLLLAHKQMWQNKLVPLAALGRTALSNYLLQSVIFTTIYFGYGFGLAGKIGPALQFAVAVCIFALQIPLSAWWLQHFRFGLAEWLWRSLTYGKLQPMRARVGATASA